MSWSPGQERESAGQLAGILYPRYEKGKDALILIGQDSNFAPKSILFLVKLFILVSFLGEQRRVEKPLVCSSFHLD